MNGYIPTLKSAYPPSPLFPHPKYRFKTPLQSKKKERTHVIPNEHTVDELQPANYDKEGHEDVYELDALRGGV